MKKIAIIGGGASGLMAAITAARNGASVTIFEKNDRVGKKILQTGNGKCNYTNIDMSAEHFHSSTDNGMIKSVLSDFNENSVIDFFEDLGIIPRKRNNGIYPFPETAAAVLDVLRMELERLGVKVVTESAVRDIKIKNGRFMVSGEIFDKVIISTGGKAAPKTGSDGDGFKLAKSFGHKIIKPLPALTQLKSNADYFKGISGVRTEATLCLYIDEKPVKRSHGELQLVDSGFSGICSFDLSSLAARAIADGKRCSILVNFFKDYESKEFAELLRKRIELHSERTAEQLFTGLFNKKLISLFLRKASISHAAAAGELKERDIRNLADLVCSFKADIDGVGDFNKAQVSSGGISLRELTGELESKKQKGLFFAGEVVDVDGICGGYNLQWAWSSGYCTGKAAAVDQN